MSALKNTIFALSSGRGKAGVAIIRISGERASECFSAFGIKNTPTPRKAALHKLRDIKTNEVLDEALMLYFPAPHSFTGDDVVELHVHGSVAVVSGVLEYLNGITGYRSAEAGEFSRRAFENSRLDLTQIEGLADLIDSETKAQAKQALRLVDGEAARQYENWRAEMIEIQAFIEAFIDFPEEDIPEDLDKQFSNKAKKLTQALEAHLQSNVGERIRNGVVATIIGEPNVGKSSLMNSLSRRDMAIVSDIAGTTRDALECHLDIAGYPLTLIDTAGIRQSNDVIEAEGVKRALAKAENSDMKIVMLNAAEYPNFNPDITKLIDAESVVIINKTDVKAINEDVVFGQNNAIKISLKDAIGVNELKTKLQKKLQQVFEQSTEAMPLTHARHRGHIEEAKQHLHNFIDARIEKLPIELCAEEIRYAANAIGKITGKIDVEDLLDKIFSSFCIGK